MRDKWVDSVNAMIASYRRMIEATVEQLTDDEFFRRPEPSINSVAIILRHLGGNLQSRWSGFFSTDGEKESRDRDSEFSDWDGDRASLMEYFQTGWQQFSQTVATIDSTNVNSTVFIRGEAHSVPQAVQRSLTHVAYHVGQIAIIARMVHEGEWKWLSIAPGKSAAHNAKTWGTAASRGVLGATDDDA